MSSRDELIRQLKRLDMIEELEEYDADWNRGSFINPIAQGISLGLSDEIEGAIRAPFTAIGDDGSGRSYPDRVKGDYVRIRDDVRKDADAFAVRNPALSTGLELGGGTVLGMKTAMKAGLPKALTFGQKLLRGTGVGALFGGTAGYGYSDEDTLSGQAADVRDGLITGAAMGAAFEPLAAITGPLANRVMDNYVRKPRSKAERSLMIDMERDGLTPDQLQARMNKLGPNATLLDAGGENMLSLGDAMANQSGRAQNSARQLMYQRDRQQGQRIKESAQSNLGVDGNYFDTLDSLVEQRRQMSGPFYDKAYEVQIPFTPELRSILSTPTGKAAIEKAKRIAGDERYNLDLMMDEAGNLLEVPDMRTWDYIKRGLDDVVFEDTADAFGKVKPTDSARAANQLRLDMLKELDELNPEYAAARNVYSSMSETKRALETGREFIRNPSEITKRQLEKFSDADKEFFRAGAYQQIRELIEKAPDNADVTKRIFGNEAVREKLKAVFPDERSFRKFTSDMLAEARMFRTKATVTGGSATARRLDKQDDLSGTMSAGLDMLSGSPTMIGRWASNRLLGNRSMDDETAKQLVRMMYSTDQSDVQAALRALRQQQSSIPLPSTAVRGGNYGSIGLLQD